MPPLEHLPVAVSERHVHLTQNAIEQLFCDNYHLHELSPLAEPPLFEAREKVTLVGPRGRIPNVRVVGPPRSENQVEISHTDALALGVAAPVRESGDLQDTPGLFLEGPRASVRLHRGVIRTLRHIHLQPEDAERYGCKDGDRVDVHRIGAESKTLFCDVLVRVAPGYKSEMHLDAEESASAGLEPGASVVIQAS